ncbi:MAG: SDR family NAD(P)-dependent oxidoreductase [Flavihumibacter sp.]
MQASNDIKYPRVLVTGGTGFVGAYIIRELVQRGYAVRATKRAGSRLPFFIDRQWLDAVEWVDADVLDLTQLNDAMQQVDAVVHAAAVVSFTADQRRQMYAVNVQGTANVMNLAIENNIGRMVHLSSVAALGRTEQGEEVDENKQWSDSRLHTHYSISKQMAEMEVWRAMAEGLNAVILNPSTVLGYGDWNSSSCAIFRQAYDGFPWYTDGINGFVAVEDLAAITVDMLETDVTMERYIVSGDNWTFRQLFTEIAGAFGKKPPHRKASAWMGALAWRLEKLRSLFSGKKPLLTRETARVARSKTYFSAKKILDLLPHRRFTALDKAIRDSAAAYQRQLLH